MRRPRLAPAVVAIALASAPGVPALTAARSLPSSGTPSLLTALCSGTSASPPAEDRSLPKPSRDEALAVRSRGLVTAERAQAVEKGLRFLAAQQDVDSGALGPPSFEGRIAITALGTLAFLAHGDLPDRGPFGRNIELGLNFLVSSALANPRYSTQQKLLGNYFFTIGDKLSRMHGHGYATLAVAEACGAYGISPETAHAGARRLWTALKGAVQLLETTQSKEGGWYYEPEPGSGHEGSITICALQALRSARAAGVQVSPECIERALLYVKESQNRNGSFAYARKDPRSSPGLTAAAVATLHAFGRYGDADVQSKIDKGMDYLAASDYALDPQWYFYNAFYMAQALYFDRSPRRPFDAFYTRTTEQLLARQDPATGAWQDIPMPGIPNDNRGREYATAFACLILEMPYQYLPILQR